MVVLFNHHRYCPTCLILTPGQYLHINKGRLHMFRKLTFALLSVTDCHYLLRLKLVQYLKSINPNLIKAPICFSVAWDWYVQKCVCQYDISIPVLTSCCCSIKAFLRNISTGNQSRSSIKHRVCRSCSATQTSTTGEA